MQSFQLTETLSNFFKKITAVFKKSESNKLPLQEFTFIWYNQTKLGDKTIYTKPIRATTKATNYDEAKKKVVAAITAKTTLVIVDETNYPKTDLGEMERTFDSFNETMYKFSKLFDKKKKGYESDFNF